MSRSEILLISWVELISFFAYFSEQLMCRSFSFLEELVHQLIKSLMKLLGATDVLFHEVMWQCNVCILHMIISDIVWYVCLLVAQLHTGTEAWSTILEHQRNEMRRCMTWYIYIYIHDSLHLSLWCFKSGCFAFILISFMIWT